ncbi:MAG: carboxymuconolactone decarboxylase family protein [Fimbriimonas sp.]
MSETSAVRYDKENPEILNALIGVEKLLASQGIDPLLYHLVKLRASQINGCAFCVRMHTHEARKDGETNERLDRLVVWEHMSDFTEKEKAAFAWTEALTTLDKRTDYATLRARMRQHFSDAEIGTLTATVGMINLWNRTQVANH